MKIAIIGAAGVLGSCSAYTLVMNKLADEVLMIDVFEPALKGHWMDLQTVGHMQGVKVTKGTMKTWRYDLLLMCAGLQPVLSSPGLTCSRKYSDH
jgi:malate/lactate dehydrogenase